MDGQTCEAERMAYFHSGFVDPSSLNGFQGAFVGFQGIHRAAELRTRHRARCLEAGDLAGSCFTL